MAEVLANFEISNELINIFGNTIKIAFFTRKQAFIITNLDKFYAKDLSSDEGPILVEKLCGEEVSDFSYGFDHIVGLSRKGKLFCWGHNRYGQLGNGGRESSHNPEQLNISSEAKIIDIKCGGYHTLALTNNGEVYAWGGNQCGQIGNRSELLYQLTPHKFDTPNFGKIKAISCGCEHSLVLTECGHVYGWGDNRDNQLGLEEKSCIYEPKHIKIEDPKLKKEVEIVKISCGSHHSLFLSDSGIIYSFGRNNFRQLGGGEKSENSVIIRIIKFIDIAAHSHHNISVALSVDSNYHIWGEYQREKGLIFSSIDQIFAHYLRVTFKSIILEDTNSSIINEFSSKNPGLDNGKYAKEFDEKNQLSEGTFGTVFEVQSRIDGKVYAIKKIPLKSDVNLGDIKKISFLKNLDNDYVVQYYEIWTENIRSIKKDVRVFELVERPLIAKDVFKYVERPLLFIRMEMYDLTLRQFIDEVRKDSTLYSGNTLTLLGYYISSQIFIEILEAVDYLHKQKIIHNNLKPYNIFLRKGSYGRIVKIAISYVHYIRKFAEKSKLNLEVETKYIAPEYLENDLNEDENDDEAKESMDSDDQEQKAKADIYSLGVILQELLDINVNRPYENTTNERYILMEKYSNACELCLKMEKLLIIDRPNIQNIINLKTLWAIDENEIDTKAINTSKESKIYPLFKMKIQNNRRYFELFENEEILGSGSYGTVFKVREKSTKQLFAIKKIAFKSEMKNEVLKQLEILKTIKILDNKYLDKYFNAWLEEEKSDKKRMLLYIQMEACDTNLLNIIEELKQNSDEKVDEIIIYYVMSELFFELLSGVDYLHKQSIIHRNLNPSNVLIKKGLDKNFVKISGFGLIDFHQFEDQTQDQYRWHLKYTAPELMRNRKYDQKTDIYSLGVILQELFRIDFYGNSDEEQQFVKPISEKISKIREYCESMTRITPNTRPNCEDLLKNRNLWALSEGDYDFKEQLKVLPELDQKFKDLLIYNIFRTKLSQKTSQTSVDMKFSEEIKITVIEAKVLMKGSKYYQMTRKPRGICVLIDNKSEEPFMESKRFESIFQQLYFDVLRVNSKTAQEIFLFLKDLSKEKRLTKDDALIVMILSHGENEKIYGYNSCKETDEKNSISISEIVDIFSEKNCIALRQTPKLFFFNCCRKKLSVVLEREKETSTKSCSEIVDQKILDENRDIFIGYSYTESCQNFQDVNSKISQFGQALSYSIAQYACVEDLQSIFTRTWEFLQKDAKLSNRPVTYLLVKYMRRQLYFNPGHHLK